MRSWLAGTAFDGWLEAELPLALAVSGMPSEALSFRPLGRRARSGWGPLQGAETLAKFGLGTVAVAATAGGLSLASHPVAPHAPGPSAYVSTGLTGAGALANSAGQVRPGRYQDGVSATRTTAARGTANRASDHSRATAPPVAGRGAIKGPGGEPGSGHPGAGSTGNRLVMPMPGAHALAPGITKGAQPTQPPSRKR